MKITKRIFLSLFCLLVSANISSANEYYCSHDANSFYSNYIYDTSKTSESECSWQKDAFFAKSNPNGYADCVKNYNELKKLFTKGSCIPILTKTYTQGSSKCIVHYYKSGNVLQKTQFSCTGPNTDSIKAQIRKIYK